VVLSLTPIDAILPSARGAAVLTSLHRRLPTMPDIETARLQLQQLVPEDAEFILRLTNSAGWLRYIGDRGVHCLDDALRYIETGPRAMFATHGHGLWRVNRRGDPTPIGLCGLIRRDSLPAPDLGFALLPEHFGQGYAAEAARACVQHARDVLRWPQLLAIAQADNVASLRLLQNLGFEVVPAATDATSEAIPVLRLQLDLKHSHPALV
jgi:ribosomal-protein-alanine N-acetyltransferase